MRGPLPPRSAVRLGFLSLLPLIASGLMCLSHEPEVAHIGGVAFAIYAAALLSFLGGVRCGFELMRAPDAPNALRLMFSTLPALAGWIVALLLAVLPVPPGAGTIFAGLFAVQFMWDARSVNAGAPLWYPLLRQVLTGGVMITCLLLPFADVLRRL